MTKTAYQVIVIGGGAAGMAAAVAALLEAEEHTYKGEQGKVLLLERNDRVGKKILATGNGKCNFTHENVGINNYHTDDPAVLDSILTAFPTEAALRFFDRLGMPAKEKNGYFYPMTETASTVLDVLRLRLAELGCETLCSIRVEQVKKAGDGFVVFLKEEKKTYEIYAASVILATGSKAGAFLQDKEEDPLRIAKSFGLHSTPLYPALTKCVCREEHYYRQLAGVRAQADISVYTKKKSGHNGEKSERKTADKDSWEFLKKESGELQLTKEGISGIAVFQLSGDIAENLAEKKQVIAEIDFLPGFAEERLETWVKDRLMLLPGRTLEEFFLGVLHKKILQVCLQAEGFQGNMRIPCEDIPPKQQQTGYLSAETRAAIMVASVMKRAMHFTTEVTSVSDMRQAQVCRGGLSLSQFTERLESKKISGLFACGEVLNVDGQCGGYNLHFAWASGALAGRAAMRRISETSSSKDQG